MFGMRQATVVRRACSSVKTGREEKRRKIPSNRDLRAGTFFPLLPGFIFLKSFLPHLIYETTQRLLDCVWNYPRGYGRGVGGVYADGDGDVWRAAGPSAQSVLADGFVSFYVCVGHGSVDRVRSAGDCRRSGGSCGARAG